MHKFLKKNKGQIFGILIAIFLVWLQPVLIQIRDYLINTFIKVSNSFSDYYYSLLSSRNENLSSDYTLFLIGLALAILLVWLVTSIIFKRKEMIEKYDEITQGLKIINEEPYVADENTPVDRINQVKEQFRNVPSKKLIIRFSNLLITFSFLYLGYFMAQAIVFKSASTEISKFEHQLKIISQNANDNEIKKIEYKWAIMENKEDYQDIKRIIESYMNKE